MITKQTIAAAESASFEATYAARMKGVPMIDALADGRRAYRAVIDKAAHTTEPLPPAASIGPRVATVELDE